MTGRPPSSSSDHRTPPPVGPLRDQPPWRPVVAVVVTLVSLAPAWLCWFMASLMTYGLYSWTEPTLDPGVALPILGLGLILPLGPLVMAGGPRRRTWLRVALVVSLGAMALASLATWVPVALGWR